MANGPRPISLNPPRYDETREADLLSKELQSIGVQYSRESCVKLLFISRRKFDRFDLFPPGETFQSRLPLWLQNFDLADRQIAMSVVDELVFLSFWELRTLAIRAFDVVCGRLRQQALEVKGTPWTATLDAGDAATEERLARTVFVAASDDVLFDFFRRNAQRSSSRLRRDNFVEYYKFHPDAQPDENDAEQIVLLDQLSGSGYSFLHFDEGAWGGKLARFLEYWPQHSQKPVLYVPYIMTEIAKRRVAERLAEWRKVKHDLPAVTVAPVLTIPPSSVVVASDGVSVDPNRPVAELCTRYHVRFVDDQNTLKGKPTTHGFGQAGLTLVLSTNVPNNTLPIIWHQFNGWVPLFPRIAHHRG